jgi:hypothetical protein
LLGSGAGIALGHYSIVAYLCRAGIAFCCHLCKLRLKLSDLRILPNRNRRRTILEGVTPDAGDDSFSR